MLKAFQVDPHNGNTKSEMLIVIIIIILLIVTRVNNAMSHNTIGAVGQYVMHKLEITSCSLIYYYMYSMCTRYTSVSQH